MGLRPAGWRQRSWVAAMAMRMASILAKAQSFRKSSGTHCSLLWHQSRQCVDATIDLLPLVPSVRLSAQEMCSGGRTYPHGLPRAIRRRSFLILTKTEGGASTSRRSGKADRAIRNALLLVIRRRVRHVNGVAAPGRSQRDILLAVHHIHRRRQAGGGEQLRLEQQLAIARVGKACRLPLAPMNSSPLSTVTAGPPFEARCSGYGPAIPGRC